MDKLEHVDDMNHHLNCASSEKDPFVEDMFVNALITAVGSVIQATNDIIDRVNELADLLPVGAKPRSEGDPERGRKS